MATLLKTLMKQLGGDGVAEIGRMLGQDQGATKGALEAVLPALVHGLKVNSSKPEGADALTRALTRDHDGGILDDVLGFLGKGDDTDGQGILGHIFGDKKERVETGLSKSTGLDLGAIVKLMGIAAPLVMGLLGKKRKERDLGSGDISDLLRREDRRVGKRTKRNLSPILSILDGDSDGDVTDDLISLGAGFLSRLFKRR